MTAKRSFSRQMSRQHLAATRALGFTLTLRTDSAWSGFRDVIALRLSDEERAALAFWALRSLSDEHAAATMQAAADLSRLDGSPLPDLCNPMDEAGFWADMAEPEELDAYCLASFNAMRPDRKADFLKFVQRGRVA